MGPRTTIPISLPHTHSNGSIQSLGTTSIRRPAPSRTTSHTSKMAYPTSNSSQAHHFPIPTRPTPPTRQNTTTTRYIQMLLSLDTIPQTHTILAAFATWILLAGFIIFPGTFTSLSKLTLHSSTSNGNSTMPANSTSTSNNTSTTTFSTPNGNDTTSTIITTTITSSLQHISLLIIASISTSLGALLMLYLWLKNHTNYIWIMSRIFLPGCLNSAAGVVSTVVQVYGQHNGVWSVTAKVTGGVAGSAMVVCGGLWVVYYVWGLESVKRGHRRDMRGLEQVVGDGEGGAWMEKGGRV